MGSCADVQIEGKNAFSEAKFDGRWYEVAIDAQFYVADAHCAMEDFVRNSNGSVILAKNTYSVTDGWK